MMPVELWKESAGAGTIACCLPSWALNGQRPIGEEAAIVSCGLRSSCIMLRSSGCTSEHLHDRDAWCLLVFALEMFLYDVTANCVQE